MLLFILFAQRLRMAQHCFNTSHVTLYPRRLLSVQCRRVFQYISCYSLSKEGIDNMKDVRSFNTSHVTLYHGIRQCTIQKQSRFNTSHVTLYHPVKIRFRWD